MDLSGDLLSSKMEFLFVKAKGSRKHLSIALALQNLPPTPPPHHLFLYKGAVCVTSVHAEKNNLSFKKPASYILFVHLNYL